MRSFARAHQGSQALSALLLLSLSTALQRAPAFNLPAARPVAWRPDSSRARGPASGRNGLRGATTGLRLQGDGGETEVQRLNRMIEERQAAIRAEQAEQLERREQARLERYQKSLLAKQANKGAGGQPPRTPSPSEILSDGSANALWSLLPKSIVSRYTLEKTLGSGSFGCVVLAREKGAGGGAEGGGSVAIKMVQTRAGEQPIVMREGIVLSLMDSPYIPRCLDYGISGDVCYFIMDYYDGTDMDVVLTGEGVLPVREVAMVAVSVLEALQSVHAAGFVHRDVKPHNILRCESPLCPASSAANASRAYRLIDFGTATGAHGCLFGNEGGDEEDVCVFTGMGEDTKRRLEAVFNSVDRGSTGGLTVSDLAYCYRSVGLKPSPEQLDELMRKYDGHRLAGENGGGGTLDGQITLDEFVIMFGELVARQDRAATQGTHGYISPEQYLGEPLTAATDLFSFGASMYKLASGRLPFDPVRGPSNERLPEAPAAATPATKAEWERNRWMKVVADPSSPPARDLREINPDIPEDFAKAVMRCLERNPDDRFFDAAEAQHAFQKVLSRLNKEKDKKKEEGTKA